jgi:hypothetical protein
MKLCPCGSGHTRRDLIDRHGVFCTFVCDRCEARKRADFNPAIFDGPYPTDDDIDGEAVAASSVDPTEDW